MQIRVGAGAINRLKTKQQIKNVCLRGSVAEPEPEPEPPEPYHFDPRRTGTRTVSLLQLPVLVPVPVTNIPSFLMYSCSYRTRLIRVSGRSFYRKNSLQFKGRNRNRGKNLGPGTGTRTGTQAKWHGSVTLLRSFCFPRSRQSIRLPTRPSVHP